jgi:hypothetical protein
MKIMSDWLKDCEICNVGLCNTVNDLKKQGLSENAACQQLSEESEGLYSKETIRNRYRWHTGKKNEVGQNDQHPIKRLMTDEEKQLYQLCAKLKRIAKALHRANPESNSIWLGPTWGVKLKSAKRDFFRTIDDYPGEGTEKQLLIWKTYFECNELRNIANEIGNWFYRQLPEELPENRSKPRKKKPRYA